MRRAVKRFGSYVLVLAMGTGSLMVPQGGFFVKDKLPGVEKNIVKAADSTKKTESSNVKTNANGTTQIVTKQAETSSNVKLVYFPIGEEGKKTTVNMKKGNNGIYDSGELFLGDKAVNLAFYFLVDGQKVVDSAFDKVEVSGQQYSHYTREAYQGRTITIPGIFPGKKWDETSNKMTYLGNELYSYTFKNVPMSMYEFTIAAGTMNETYGVGGELNGAHYYVTVPKLQDITIYYTDYGTHYMTTSLKYDLDEKRLTGAGISEKLEDPGLTGVFSKTVSLPAGTYSDFKLTYQGKTYPVASFKLDASKDVTFYFDPINDIFYNTSSEVNVAKDSVTFDSRNTDYKSQYGSVCQDEKVKFSIKTGADVTKAQLIVSGKEVKNIDLNAKESSDGKVWSETVSFPEYGEYTYFFVLYYGSYAKIYCDDDGYFGTGVLTDLSKLKPYELVVSKKGYKTPDWMKNAVVYQIFPDRFFNADKSNDDAQVISRGNSDYEFVTDWYTWPENPYQELVNPSGYPEKAFRGDGLYSNDIFGGDLEGITKRISYLKALGVNVIYLNPVMSSISDHRYDTSDYSKIDPILGNMGDFKELVKAAKKNGMHIIMDGVFNHVSDDSIYFDRYYRHVGENGKVGAYPYWAYIYDYQKSHENVSLDQAKQAAKTYFKGRGVTDFSYTEWFEIKESSMLDEEGKVAVDMIGERPGKDVYEYDAWWGYTNMPVVLSTNGSEYQTGNWADKVINGEDSVTQFWVRQGSNGWRLDCANEVSDETWQRFRESVKAVNSDNVIVGEIWTDASRYLLGDMYDSVMNYVFRDAVLSFATGGNAKDSINMLERIREKYPKEAFYAMMNLVGSHDTPRVLSYLDAYSKRKDTAFPTYEKTSSAAKAEQYLVALLQMTYPGAPTIYYGDEVGMVGSGDPDCRRAMIWGKGNKKIVEWYATLTNIRSKYSALRTGDVASYDIKDAKGNAIPSLMCYTRTDSKNQMLVVANNTGKNKKITLNLSSYMTVKGKKITDLVSGKKYTLSGKKVTITVPAYKGVILTEQEKSLSVNYNGLKPAYVSSYTVKNSLTKVSLNKTKLTLKAGAKQKLTVSYKPTNICDAKLVWSSSNKKAVTVKNGVVTAVKKGTSVITVRVNGKLTAKCKVTVK